MNQIKAGAVLNYIIIGLNILCGLFYTPFMLRCLGQNEYGLYSLVASVIAYLTLLDFGFGSAIVRYAARIRATGSKEEEWRLYGMFISGYTLIGIIVTLAGMLLYFNVDNMFDRTMNATELHQARIMMAIMILNLAVTFPFSVYGSIITAYERFVFTRVLSIIRIFLTTGVLVAVLLMGYRALGLVVVQTIFSFATLFINWLYCKYRLGIKVEFNHFNIPLLREIMIFSWWNFIGAIVDKIYWGTGQFILGAMCGTIAVAVFSLAVTITMMYLTMSTSLNSVLLPRLTVLAVSRENDKEISDIFIRTGRLQFCVMALILSGFAVFGKSFINLWAGPGYAETFVITLMFFIALLCPLIQNVGISILLARGQMKFRALCLLAIAILSLTIQLFLARPFGAIGCAIGVSAALFMGQWIAMNIYYSKRQRIAVGAFCKQIAHMALVPAALTAGGLIAVNYVEIDTWSRLGVGVSLYMCVYLPSFWHFSMNGYERSQVSQPLSRVLAIIRR